MEVKEKQVPTMKSKFLRTRRKTSSQRFMEDCKASGRFQVTKKRDKKTRFILL